MNLIIGDNGAWKSSLLGGVSLGLGGLLYWENSIDSKQITKKDVRVISTLVGDVTESVEYCLPVKVSCEFELNGADYETSFSYDENGKGDVSTHKQQISFDAINAMKELLNDRTSSLPLLSYQSDERQFFTVIGEASRPSGNVERRQGYKDCLKGTASVE